MRLESETNCNFFLDKQKRKDVWEHTTEGWNTKLENKINTCSDNCYENAILVNKPFQSTDLNQGINCKGDNIIDKSNLIENNNIEEDNIMKIQTSNLILNEIKCTNKTKYMYLLFFISGRTLLGVSREILEVYSKVVVASDRGEDLATVIAEYDSDVNKRDFYKNLIETYNDVYIREGYDENTVMFFKTNYLNNKPIEILRVSRKISPVFLYSDKEKSALKTINQLKEAYKLDVEITKCEYQWDGKRVTVYYRASERIDFRALVRELFKYFKIRIWMCSENRELYKQQ
ncbi:YOM2 [Hepatospora eriocheir]|uniref:YOM2 n=1 Tax=Hepatospora eriocheir TaxID=1081669 RepID=A0A1X0Q8V8_9MICR|nr:YOM2 [Hepatospora eriocheir]